ncbi:hypothetical protein NFI96_007758 [Prochilodus magdalenae]|nr:hypothetical protein NFI96_007758 [Prochilodus magdalenae]
MGGRSTSTPQLESAQCAGLISSYRTRSAEVIAARLPQDRASSMNSSEWQRTNGPSTVLQTIDSDRAEKERAP